MRAVDTLSCGVKKMVIPFPVDTHVRICQESEVWINVQLYNIFGSLNLLWDELKAGTMVACRSLEGDPNSLYRCGECHSMTCGKTISIQEAKDPASGWKKAKGSKEWVYRRCLSADRNSTPCFCY